MGQSGETPQAPAALVTGCAGFLGSHLCEALLAAGRTVVGVDCFTDYYPRSSKEANISALREQPGFTLVEVDLAEASLAPLLEGVGAVFHLAAQPGVRPSFGRGFRAYLRDNVQATQRLLEAASEADLAAFVYASSSSVYGEQKAYPVVEDAPVSPVSPYGATKVITEQLAEAFWRSAGVPTVGLRYFTVYGPRQRPDMAFSRFLSSALAGRPLSVLGDGRQVREFTYVDDVVAATLAAATHGTRGSVYNIGGGQPVALLDVIEMLAQLLGKRPAVEHLEAAPGDPRRTDADIGRAMRDLGYRPSTPLADGLASQLETVAAARRKPAGIRVSGGGGAGSDVAAGPRVLAYSHDGYGLGHFRRNLRLVGGLRRRRPDVQAMLVTGARSAQRLIHGRGVECVQLPAVVKVANGRYVAADGEGSERDVIRHRAEVLAAVVRDFQPDLLLVDRYPRGMHDELAPALRAHARQRPGAPCVLGLRDILDEGAVIREEWRAGGYTEAIVEGYSSVLCYGDRAVYDPVEEYALADEVTERLRFTGYLADELLVADASQVRLEHGLADGRLAVCTLGGGRDAIAVARCFLDAMERLGPRGWAGVLIAGPYMSGEDRQRLAAHPAARWAQVLAMVDDVPSYLAGADAAVCMGGYNTTCELLALAVPAVIVPRVRPRREQQMRAERLGARGLLRWLHPSRMSGAVLAEMVEDVAARPRSELVDGLAQIERHGVHAAAEHLAALLPASRRALAPQRHGDDGPEPSESVGALA